MSISEEHLNIPTPENVAFGYRIAGIGSRFIAALVDTLIITLLQILIFVAVMSGLLAAGDVVNDTVLGWVMALSGLLYFVFYWGYYIFFEWIWNGKSPGKKLARLRVIRSDGMPVTLPESVLRNLVRLIDLLPGFYGLGVVVMFLNPQARRLGDLAAGTLVVHDQQPVTLRSLESEHSSVRTWGQGALSPELAESLQALPVERLAPADLALVEEFLRRPLSQANRDRLAGPLADKMLAQMELPPGSLSHIPRTLLLAQLVQAHRVRSAQSLHG